KTPMPRFPNQVDDFFSSYRYYLTDQSTGSVKLPHDYKYDDAKPLESVSPAAYFGDIVELGEYENPRQAFAAWMTSTDNPRFTINLVNRMWKFAFGLAQIEPVYNIPGHLDGQAQNYELVKYLERIMKDLNYSVKDFLRIVYNTKTYQREANRVSPTMAQVDRGEYHFPAPILRRMSAEQMWDSMVALTTDNPEYASRRMLEGYRQAMAVDWSDMNLKQVQSHIARINSLDAVKLGSMTTASNEDSMMEMKGSGGGRKGSVDPLLVRSSERRLPDRRQLLLTSFGQSDKQIIQGSHKLGSIPQVMFMLNGEMTNKLITRDESAVVKNARASKSQSEGVETVYLSILNRKPNSEELRTATKLVEGDDYSDLIWALLNSREFMFIQ
ncbi:MAG: DUF1553 domain-containing protein, partial [Verrucomicrobiota bacterium]